MTPRLAVREVLPPRLPFWPRLFLACLLTGCLSATVRHVATSPTVATGIPLTVWRTELPTSWWSRPAVLCLARKRTEAPVWGTSWHCPIGPEQ